MMGQTNRTILGPKLQRRLRKEPTEAARLLWRMLRGRQLEGCKFRRQHPFADCIPDFICLERPVVVELDGSRHSEMVQADVQRTETLRRAGFVVLRFWNNEVFSNIGGVPEAIRQSLEARATPSPPKSPLERDG